MLHCRLCFNRYAAVQIKNCLKSTSAIKIAIVTNTDNFRYKGKPSRAIAKSTLFAVSKDEWDTKEDTGKSKKTVLYVLCQKAPVGPKQCQTVKLAIIELCLSEGISQSVTRKFH